MHGPPRAAGREQQERVSSSLGTHLGGEETRPSLEGEREFFETLLRDREREREFLRRERELLQAASLPKASCTTAAGERGAHGEGGGGGGGEASSQQTVERAPAYTRAHTRAHTHTPTHTCGEEQGESAINGVYGYVYSQGEGGVECEEGNGGGVENTATLSGEERERERERERVAQRRLDELGATSSTATLF